MKSQEERYNMAKEHFTFDPVSKSSPNIPDVNQDFSLWEENTSLRYRITDAPNQSSHYTWVRWTSHICTAKHMPAKATRQGLAYFWACFNWTTTVYIHKEDILSLFHYNSPCEKKQILELSGKKKEVRKKFAQYWQPDWGPKTRVNTRSEMNTDHM